MHLLFALVNALQVLYRSKCSIHCLLWLLNVVACVVSSKALTLAMSSIAAFLILKGAVSGVPVAACTPCKRIKGKLQKLAAKKEYTATRHSVHDM